MNIDYLSYEELLNLDIDYVINNIFISRALKRANIYTLNDLISYNTFELKNIRNLGEERIQELISKVHALGLCFQDEVAKIINYLNVFANLDEVTLKDEELINYAKLISGRERGRDSIKLSNLVNALNNK